MDRKRNLDIAIKYLLAENKRYADISIHESLEGKQQLLRSLMNVRIPRPLSVEYIASQDAELRQQLMDKGVVTLAEISACADDTRLRLWQGDITRLQVDAIVNAANSQMLGCFVPMHRCIDNAIHSAADCSCVRLAMKSI